LNWPWRWQKNQIGKRWDPLTLTINNLALKGLEKFGKISALFNNLCLRTNEFEPEK